MENWLIGLKRMIFGITAHELLSRAVREYPVDLKERIVTVDDFLSNLRFSHFHPLNPGHFQQINADNTSTPRE